MNMIDIWRISMTDQPADSYCKGCEFLKLIYELDDRQYYFGCENRLTCNKVEESEENKNGL